MQIHKSPLADTKISKIISQGSQKLHIVADFDGTLTPEYDLNGKPLPTGVALIRESDLLGPQYRFKAKELFEYYHPFEKDHNLDLETKKEMMFSWWQKHRRLMVESGISQQIIDQITASNTKIFRDHAPKFFKLLDELKIPILILSAGIGNVIDNLMKQNNFTYPNIHIISNYFNFNLEGKAEYDENQIIHSFNKNETAISGYPYSKEIINRTNIILLGNNLGDVQMSDGIKADTVLKIGFLDKTLPDNSDLKSFLQLYDVVIVDSGDLGYVNKILSKL
jgi:HAD superfamily hydrolase (TIGR01544 family)